MVAVRGGQFADASITAIGSLESIITGAAVQNNGTGAMVCPTLINKAQKGLWLGFVGRAESDNDEDFSVTGGHTLLVQHVAGVVGGARSSAISVQAGVAAHATISANEFLDGEAAGNRRTFSLFIDPI